MRVILAALRVILAAIAGYVCASIVGMLVATAGERLDLAFGGGRGESWQFIVMGAGIISGAVGAILGTLGVLGFLKSRWAWGLLTALGGLGLVWGLWSVASGTGPIRPPDVWLLTSVVVGGGVAAAVGSLGREPTFAERSHRDKVALSLSLVGLLLLLFILVRLRTDPRGGLDVLELVVILSIPLHLTAMLLGLTAWHNRTGKVAVVSSTVQLTLVIGGALLWTP